MGAGESIRIEVYDLSSRSEHSHVKEVSLACFVAFFSVEKAVLVELHKTLDAKYLLKS